MFWKPLLVSYNHRLIFTVFIESQKRIQRHLQVQNVVNRQTVAVTEWCVYAKFKLGGQASTGQASNCTIRL